MARLAVARSPLSFHPTEAPPRNSHVNRRFPLGDEVRDSTAQLFPMPAVEQLSSPLSHSALRDVEQEPLPVEFDMGATRPLDNGQAAPESPDVVGLTGDHL